MKKITVLLLAVLMLASVALTGCGAKDRMEGTWEGTVDLKTGLEESLKAEDMGGIEDYIKLDGNYEITLIMEFEDGEYKKSIDKKDAEKMMEALMDDFSEGAVKYLKDEVKKMGASEADFEAEYGMSIEKFVEEEVEQEFDMESFIDELDLEGKGEYELDGDELILTNEDDEEVTYTVELKKKTFVFTDCDGDDEEEEFFSLLLEDVTFKKQ